MDYPPKPAASFAFNHKKAIAVIGYLAARVEGLDRFKLAKLVFLADEYHLVRHGRPIVGGNYWALPAGPVPEEVLDAIRRLANAPAPRDHSYMDDDLARVIFIDHGHEYPIISKGEYDPPLGVLSDSDIAALDHAIRQYGRFRFEELFDLTHSRESYRIAWKNRGGGRSARMYYEHFFEGNKDRLADSLRDFDRFDDEA